MLRQLSEVDWLKEGRVADPVYTVVIPAYKRLDTLRRALASAEGQKTDVPYVVLVVDDDPERGTDLERYLSAIDDPKVAYCKNRQNAGLVGNWNQGAMLARTPWIVMLHDDDELTPDCIANIDATRRRHPDAKAVLPRYTQRDNPFTGDQCESGGIKALVKRAIPKGVPMAANLFCDNIYGPPTVGLAVERAALVDFGGWPDRFVAADWDFMLHFSQRYPVVRNQGQTGVYNWGSNYSLKPGMMEKMSGERRVLMGEIIEKDAHSRRLYHLVQRSVDDRLSHTIGTEEDSGALFRILQSYYRIRIS